MADEKILDRVRKLLELAKSDNIYEAASAAAQAQALMSRHAIEQAMLSTVTAEEEIEQDVLDAGSGATLATWRGALARAICEANGCTCLRSGAQLLVIGRPSDASKVRYLHRYVEREIERLCKLALDERGNPGRTWANNFKLGAVSAARDALVAVTAAARAAARREADASDTLGSGAALVRVNSALAKLDAHRGNVEAYMRRRYPNIRAVKRTARTDVGAREAGRRAGASIDLGGSSKGSLGSGSRAALGR